MIEWCGLYNLIVYHVLQQIDGIVFIGFLGALSHTNSKLVLALDSKEELWYPDQEVVWCDMHPLIDAVDDLAELSLKRLFLIDSEVGPLLNW